MATVTVSNASQLTSALAAASSGDTILLQGGDYGRFDFNNLNYDDYVTIKSADAQNRAVFEDIDIVGSNHIAIENVHVDNGSDGEFASKVVNIDGGSQNIRFTGSEVNGKVDQTSDWRDFDGHYGIFTGDARNVLIEDNYVHDIKNGIVGLGSDDIEVNGNRIDRIGNDGMKFAGVDGILIENNTGASFVVPAPDAHLDFIQFQGASQNIVIRGNVYLAGSTGTSQGIFLDDAPYTNVLIEQNIIYTGMANGIFISEGSNITIRENTVLNAPDLVHNATIIRAVPGSTVVDNIISDTNGDFSGSNIRVQHAKLNESGHYSDLFENAEAGLGITLADLRPVSGSLAQTKGAAERLAELLGEEPPAPDNNSDPQDTPPAGNAPPPADDPAQPDTEQNGTSGNDKLVGSNDFDRLIGYDGNDTIKGNGGNDILKGSAGNDNLKGNSGADKLKGGDGSDKLKGGWGDDTLKGSAGDDRIFGNAGDDYLKGQRGNDEFVFKHNDGNDRIQGFKRGEDVIHIRNGADGMDDLRIENVADGALISFTGTTILLIDRDANDLDASDFIF
ncbi:MAG: right-handed parallel beta-helix repeat-containing protein [Pseudomonadota bacterium]